MKRNYDLKELFLVVASFTFGMFVMSIIVFQDEIGFKEKSKFAKATIFDLPNSLKVDEKTLLIKFRNPGGNWRWFKVEFDSLTEKDTLYLSPYLTITVKGK